MNNNRFIDSNNECFPICHIHEEFAAHCSIIHLPRRGSVSLTQSKDISLVVELDYKKKKNKKKLALLIENEIKNISK